MKALILSGGQGTRLRPLTLSTLKPLIPIANAPFLSYPAALLRKHGIKDLVLCTQGDLSPYRSFIQTQKKLGTNILCSQETKELGTAGALKNAHKTVDSSPFFVFNGDILTDLDCAAMLRFHRAKKSLITIALVQVPDPSLYGLVSLAQQGRIARFQEKPSVVPGKKHYWINSGIYLFEKEALELIPQGVKCSTERELFPLAIRKNLRLHGFQTALSTYWLDIGAPQKYLQANLDVAGGKYRAPFARKVGAETRIHPSAKVSGSVIGNRCKVEAGSVLKNCVLLDRVRIEPGVSLEGCVIGNGCRVGERSRIARFQVLGDGSRITPYSNSR